MRDKKKEESNRGKPNWEHLNDELHVLIQCEDTEDRAKIKLKRAVDEISKLLVPAPEGEDELKRKQLMELAIINGTYRPANQGKPGMQTPRLLTPMTLPSPLRSPTLGAPIILSPNRGMGAAHLNGMLPNCPIPSAFIPNSPSDFAANTAALFVNSPFGMGLDPAFAAAYSPYAAAAAALSSPLLAGEYPALDPCHVGQLFARGH
jgi:hypothetical protein